MVNYLNGLNTGILMNEQGFVAIAFKVKTSNGQTNLFYMQGEALRSLMMILQNRLVSMHVKIASGQKDKAALIESATQELVNNLPALELKDVEQPDPGCLVSSLSVSLEEDDFKLLLIQKNESLHHIKVADAQIQFMMVAIAKALDNLKNPELVNLLTSGINYAPIYDAEFNQNGSIDYSMVESEHWQLDLFNKYFLIVYGIENQDGFNFKLGAIVKTHAVVNEQELDIIARNLAKRSKRLTPYAQQISLIKTATLDFDKDSLPTPKDALQPLAEFHKSLRTK